MSDIDHLGLWIVAPATALQLASVWRYCGTSLIHIPALTPRNRKHNFFVLSAKFGLMVIGGSCQD
jgi:hypothetical protein